jgi:hypothetical protein
MSRCTHAWTNRPVRRDGIKVTVLRCRRCGKTLVQTYTTTIDTEQMREARRAAASSVRNEAR